MPLSLLVKAFHLVRYAGIGFCAFRAQYAIQKKTGLLKRKFSTLTWSRQELSDWLDSSLNDGPEKFLEINQSNGRHFFFKSRQIPSLNVRYRKLVISPADQILQNNFTYFFDRSYPLGSPPDWFINPETAQQAKSDCHWCDIQHFDPSIGDIKFIWEPSRFAWVYMLVRAYAATDEERYVEKFWSLLESWLAANQPNIGPNYACGQECAIRLMAMCFAFYAFRSSSSSSPERLAKLALAIAVHADRIEKNIGFAISTRTNHSLTEAAGLYTCGILFSEFSRSRHWHRLGKKILISEGLKQIYADGTYLQHSMNYHRLMLQDFLWVFRLAELNQDSFPDELTARIKKAVHFLYQMQDDTDGRVPNYGANDGALIIPLNGCDYLDFRPVLQTWHYYFHKTKLYRHGPWDEDLLWFFGSEAMDAEQQAVPRKSCSFPRGGYYSLRRLDNWALLRCHSFRDRPGHADALHLDLWWKGINILRDSGSFMYNCAEPWQSYFGSTPAHNTLTVNHENQMSKLSRFMWMHWTRAKLIQYQSNVPDKTEFIRAEHYSYNRHHNNITHRRTVLPLDNQCWLIIDDIFGSGSHRLDLYWNLPDEEYQLHDNLLTMTTPQGPISLWVSGNHFDLAFKSCRGNEERPAGWQSLYYGRRSAVPVFVTAGTVALPTRFYTLLSLGAIIQNMAINEKNDICWNLDSTDKTYSLNPSSLSLDDIDINM